MEDLPILSLLRLETCDHKDGNIHNGRKRFEFLKKSLQKILTRFYDSVFIKFLI